MFHFFKFSKQEKRHLTISRPPNRTSTPEKVLPNEKEEMKGISKGKCLHDGVIITACQYGLVFEGRWHGLLVSCKCFMLWKLHFWSKSAQPPLFSCNTTDFGSEKNTWNDAISCRVPALPPMVRLPTRGLNLLTLQTLFVPSRHAREWSCRDKNDFFWKKYFSFLLSSNTFQKFSPKILHDVFIF